MNKKASVGIVVLIISILILAFAIYLLVSKISSNSEYSENSSYNSANNSQYYSKSTDLDIDESNNLLYVAESNNPKIDIYDLNQLKIIDTLDSGYSPADFSEARIYVDSSLSKAFVYSKTSTKKEFTIFDLKCDLLPTLKGEASICSSDNAMMCFLVFNIGYNAVEVIIADSCGKSAW
ncbi:MAG TPA: hypothetical protein VJH97_02665, partial [Candidatus Nanoarchaeia archaeon]|nr:hypothetical protein [Candidatus Nanoarchaeia archaeon]